jgi:hypothetical protein
VQGKIIKDLCFADDMNLLAEMQHDWHELCIRQ